MIQRILAGSSLMAMLLLGGWPTQAQTPSPAPSAAPSAPASSVSPQELSKFAGAVKQILTISQTAETAMAQAVRETGLDDRRFNEIYLAKKDPKAKPPAKPITSAEQQSYDRAMTQLTQIQQKAQTDMDNAIAEQGLKMDRFNQILAIVQSNKDVQNQVRELLKQPTQPK